MEKIIERINRAENIVVYGAGKRAKLFLPVLFTLKSKDNIQIVVSKVDEKKELMGIPIVQVNDLLVDSNMLGILALGESNHPFAEGQLSKIGLVDYIKLDEEIIFKTKKWALYTQLKKCGIDLNLLCGFSADDIYGLFWNGDFRDKCKSIKNRMWEIANEETTRYVMEHMLKAREFSNKQEYHLWIVDYLKKSVLKPGINFEFGVANGESINRFAKYTSDIFYGFDSFEGLPENWMEGYEKDRFSLQQLPIVDDNVELVKGWFDESLAEFVRRKDLSKEMINFIHIDCDLYSSTKTVFQYLGPYIQNGTFIAFDEYFNYPGWKDNEFKAFQEWLKQGKLEFEYIAYVENYSQVFGRIVGIDEDEKSK